eukprot:366471-Chlamydomonas_euryale.AAC.2
MQCSICNAMQCSICNAMQCSICNAANVAICYNADSRSFNLECRRGPHAPGSACKHASMLALACQPALSDALSGLIHECM